MNGIKFEIQKLTQEITEVLIKPALTPPQHLFDINYYSFSHQVLHAAQMILQCLEVDVMLRNQFKKLVAKMKEAAKCRPEDQSEDEQQVAGKDEISVFLNTRKPIVENKDRGQLYKFLTIREQKQKDNQNFLHHMNKVKAMTLIKQKSHRTETKEQTVQTDIAWISELQYRTKQQANYYQNYLRSYIENHMSKIANTLPEIHPHEQKQIEPKKDKVKKSANNQKKGNKVVRQQNAKKEEEQGQQLADQFKKSNLSSKKTISNISSKQKITIQQKAKRILNKKSINEMQNAKSKHSIQQQNDLSKTIDEENIENELEQQNCGESENEAPYQFNNFQNSFQKKQVTRRDPAQKKAKKQAILQQKDQVNQKDWSLPTGNFDYSPKKGKEGKNSVLNKTPQSYEQSHNEKDEIKDKQYDGHQEIKQEKQLLKEDLNSGSSKPKKQKIEEKIGPNKKDWFKNSQLSFHGKQKTETEQGGVSKQKNKENLPIINPSRSKQLTASLQRGSGHHQYKLNSSYHSSSKRFDKTPQINLSCHEQKKQHGFDHLQQKVDAFLNKPNIQSSQLRQKQKQILLHMQSVHKQYMNSTNGLAVLAKKESQIKQCIKMMQAIHRRVCGKTCRHLDRFYSMTSMFKVTGKKQLKLAKYMIDSNNV